MPKVRLAFVTLVSAALAASAVAAQDDDSDLSTKETRALMHSYAKCVVARQPRKASEALLADIGNEEILRDYPGLIIADCLRGEPHFTIKMRFKGDIYRYALADALVSREFAARPVPDLTAVPRLSHREPGAEPQRTNLKGKRLSARKYEEALKDFGERRAISFLSKYGECGVRLSTAEARALLMTPPDSAEETARFAALRPALETCMAEGQSIRFGRVALRGSIAINYYRLAHAAGPVAAAGEN